MAMERSTVGGGVMGRPRDSRRGRSLLQDQIRRKWVWVPNINGVEIKPTMDADGVLWHEGQQVAEPSEVTMFPHTSDRQMGISQQEMEGPHPSRYQLRPN